MMAAGKVGRALAVTLALSVAFAIVFATVAVADSPQPVILAPLAGSWTRLTTPTISGTTDEPLALVTVAVYPGPTAEGTPAAVLQTLLPPLEGSWSVAPELPLEDGQYTAVAEQTDLGLERGSSLPVTFTVDTTPPAVSITAPGALTNDASPTLSGAAGVADGDLPHVSIAIHEGASTAGTVIAEQDVAVSGGTWTYAASALKDGTYTAAVIQEDEAGNRSEAQLTFQIDTSPPLVSINSPGALINRADPTLSGAGGSAAGDLPTVLVAVHRGSSLTGPLVAGQLVAVSSGTWSYTPAALPDGIYTADVFQEDEAGNIGHGVPVTFAIDTTPPVVDITAPSYGAVLHESQPIFAGQAGAALGDDQSVTLKIYADGPGSEVLVDTLSGLKPNESTWTTGSSGPRLPNGPYTVVAEQSDAAGNVGLSKPVAFTIETLAPLVTLDEPGLLRAGEERVTGATPSFSGSRSVGPEDGATVKVNIYAGPSASSSLTPVQSLEASVKGSAWTAGPAAPLPDGVYTVQAEQIGSSKTGFSSTFTFTVDADAPVVTITAPTQGATGTATPVPIGGAAGTAPGDAPTVTVRLFAGATVSPQALAQELTVPVAAGAWSHSLAALAPGTYTLQALQSDDVGNLGTSTPVTFTLAPAQTAPPAPQTAPSASFQWFPAAPRTGEVVSLVSTSVDLSSAITGFSWSLPEAGLPIAGAAVAQTTFVTPGPHLVRLTVTDASGLAGTVDETIPVSAQTTPLMQPFPIVRIAGSESQLGAKITLLTVQAPIGAKVAISCSGKSCPARLVSALASASKGKTGTGTVVITFRRFERALRAGVRLEIRVSRSGQIGKYTRFTIRKGKLPTRSDSCLSATGIAPIACPST